MRISASMKIGGASLAAILLSSAPALAVYSYTDGGHAYTSSTKTVFACDKKDDGHEIEGQSRHTSGPVQFVRDSASSPLCTGNTYGITVTQIRACKLMLFDDCDTWRTR